MRSVSLRQARAALRGAAAAKRAAFLPGYLNTSRGQYGAGDVFIGVTVPALRTVAKRHREMTLPDLGWLVRSGVNEERVLALQILVLQHERAHATERVPRFDFYLRHLGYLNTWNLIDGSAPPIVGLALAGRAGTNVPGRR